MVHGSNWSGFEPLENILFCPNFPLSIYFSEYRYCTEASEWCPFNMFRIQVTAWLQNKSDDKTLRYIAILLFVSLTWWLGLKVIHDIMYYLSAAMASKCFGVVAVVIYYHKKMVFTILSNYLRIQLMNKSFLGKNLSLRSLMLRI